MKINKKEIAFGFLLLLPLLSSCSAKKFNGMVPEDWYVLPENGTATNPGSIDQLGNTVDKLFTANANALAPLGTTESPTGTNGKPVDWVPWHLAGLSSDFAITGSGILGALLFEGSASVQGSWFHKPDLDTAPHFQNAVLAKTSSHSKTKAALVIHGEATHDQVMQQLEPSIQAALATGAVKDEDALRATLATSAENFRAMAWQLSNVQVQNSQMAPSAFVLEVTIGADGNVTPVFGVGAAVYFRFDWIIKNAGATKTVGTNQINSPLATNAVGQKLQAFVQAITPDFTAAIEESAPMVEQNGFRLSSIRVGLGLSGDYDFGIAQASAETMGSIVFGDNDDEGGCYDPDGDGDCHPQPQPKPSRQLTNISSASEAVPASAEMFKLVGSNPKPEHLAYADANAIPYQVSLKPIVVPLAPQNQVAFSINHNRFRSGLRKAIHMASFFADHAAKTNANAWRLKELETEYDLSISGDLGMTTLQGTGEVEMEFENTRFLQ